MRELLAGFLVLISATIACAQNVVTNPSSTQTIQGTGASTIPLVVQQTPTGAIAFQVKDAAGNVLSQWDGINGQSIGSWNNVRWIDGVKYTKTCAGVQSALADLPSVGGMVIITDVFPLGACTLTVGTVSGGDSAKAVTLWFMATSTPASHWTCSGNPCISLGTHSNVWGLGRHTLLEQTVAGNKLIEVPNTAETWSIRDIKLLGGVNCIKMRGSTPNFLIHRVMCENQTGNAIEQQAFTDLSVMSQVFVNSPGGACWRLGVHSGDISADEVGANGGTVMRFFCQGSGTTGTKGIWIEPTAFGSLALLGDLVLDGIQVLNTQQEALYIAHGGDGPISIRNLKIGSPSLQGLGLYSAVKIGNGGGTNAPLSNVTLDGIRTGGVVNQKHGIDLNCAGMCVISNSDVGGNTANLFLNGQINLVSNVGGTIDPTSNYVQSSTFKTDVLMKNSANLPLTVTLDPGNTTKQNAIIRLSDRGTPKWDLINDGSNNLLLNASGLGLALQVLAGTVRPLFPTGWASLEKT